jgi:hypothetical protein
MVGTHTSSGVEGTNNLVLRHLRAVCHDPDFRNRWASPEVLGLVQFIINDSVSTETGIRRFDALFGSYAGSYLKVPATLAPMDRSHAYLDALNDDLTNIRRLCAESHKRVITERQSGITPDTQNTYLAGEFVLYQRPQEPFLPTKLTMPFAGPFQVLRQERNRVTVRNLATHEVSDLPVERLKIWHGTKDAAELAAAEDHDLTRIESILGWKGNHHKRSSLEFKVLFADGDILWLPFSPDIERTEVYGNYVASIPPLKPLVHRLATDSTKAITRYRKLPIAGYDVGDILYVDIRFYGHEWYDTQLSSISDRYDILYVVPFEVTVVHSKYINCYCALFDEAWNATSGPTCLDNWWCTAWGCNRHLIPDKMCLVSVDVCRQFPDIISADLHTRTKFFSKHSTAPYTIPVQQPQVEPTKMG